MSLSILQSVDVTSIFQRSFVSRKLLTHFGLLLSHPQNVRHQFIDVGHFFTFAPFEVGAPSFIGLKSWGFDGHPFAGQGWPSKPPRSHILTQNVKGVSMATPGQRRGGQRTPGQRRGRGSPPTILISIHFDTKCKGVSLATPFPFFVENGC